MELCGGCVVLWAPLCAGGVIVREKQQRHAICCMWGTLLNYLVDSGGLWGKLHVVGTLPESGAVGALQNEWREEEIVESIFNISPHTCKVLGLMAILWIKVVRCACNLLYNSATRWIWNTALWYCGADLRKWCCGFGVSQSGSLWQWVRVEVGILILLSCRTLIGRGLLGCGHVGGSAGRSNGAEWGLKQKQVL